jgi:predicted Zn-dependent protease
MGGNPEMKKTLLLLCLFMPLVSQAKVSVAYQNYSRGVELAAKKKWEEARAKFQAAIELNPAFTASYIEWARAAVMLKRRTEGLNKLSTALAFTRTEGERNKVFEERDSLSEIFYTNEAFQQYQNGLNYIRLDRASSAMEALEKARAMEPDNVLVLNAYANALRSEERHKEAVEVLETAFSLNEGKRAVRLDLAEAVLAREPQRAQLLLKPMLQEESDERVFWLQAQSLAAQKRNREAIEFLKESLDKNPGWIFAPFWLGKLYALEANEAWNARKYLMTFLRRTQPSAEKTEDRKLQAARAEAEEILARVNQALE